MRDEYDENERFGAVFFGQGRIRAERVGVDIDWIVFLDYFVLVGVAAD